MVSTLSCTTSSLLSPTRGTSALTSRRPAGHVQGMSRPSLKFASRTAGKKIVPAAGFVEIAQVASEQAEVFGPAGIVFACTLVGLAAGFVLLRVESLVEEGKIEI